MTSASTHDVTHARPDHRDHATLQNVKEDVRELKEDTVDYATGMAETGVDAVKRSAHAVAAGAQGARKRMSDYVAAHPTASVLIAFGLGAVAARLFLRIRS
jgi:ElaB/YqjD/DUF883 family membrane-anchored ribosome-binding protein